MGNVKCNDIGDKVFSVELGIVNVDLESKDFVGE